jgi:hypothetical protein
MSESLQENPYPYGSPEYNAFMRAQPRGAFLGGAALAPGLESLLRPADVTGGSGVAGYLPGAATGFYGAVGQLVPKLLNYFNGTNLPNAPGSETASNLADQSFKNAMTDLPADKLANTPEEQTVVDAVAHAAPLAVPGIGGAITRLPLAARIPAKAAELMTGVMSPEMVPTAAVIQATANTVPNAVQTASENAHPDKFYSDYADELKQQTAQPPAGQSLPVPPIPPDQVPADQGGPQTPPFQRHISKPSPVMSYLVRAAQAAR